MEAKYELEKLDFSDVKDVLTLVIQIKRYNGKIGVTINKSDEQEVDKENLYNIVCKDLHVNNKQKKQYAWLIYGKKENDNEECLQVASSNDIWTEMKQDTKAMIYEPTNKIRRDTYFYKDVFDTYQCRYTNPIYYDMFNNYSELYFYILKVDEYLKKLDIEEQKYIAENTDSERAKANFAEVWFAYQTMAVYWNPFGKENNILKHIMEFERKGVFHTID